MRKRQWKKILSVVLALSMIFSMNFSVFAEPVSGNEATGEPVTEEPAEEETVTEEPVSAEEGAPADEVLETTEEKAGEPDAATAGFLGDWEVGGTGEITYDDQSNPKTLTMPETVTSLTLKSGGELSANGFWVTPRSRVKLISGRANCAVIASNDYWPKKVSMNGAGDAGIMLEAGSTYYVYIGVYGGKLSVSEAYTINYNDATAVLTDPLSGALHYLYGKILGDGTTQDIREKNGVYYLDDVAGDQGDTYVVGKRTGSELFIYYKIPNKGSTPSSPAKMDDTTSTPDKIVVAVDNDNEYQLTDEYGYGIGYSISQGKAEGNTATIIPPYRLSTGSKYYVRQRKPATDSTFPSDWSKALVITFAEEDIKELSRLESRQIYGTGATVYAETGYKPAEGTEYRVTAVSSGNPSLPPLEDKGSWKTITKGQSVSFSDLYPGTGYYVYGVKIGKNGTAGEEAAGAEGIIGSYSQPVQVGYFATVGTYEAYIEPKKAAVGIMDSRPFGELFDISVYADGEKINITDPSEADEYKGARIEEPYLFVSRNGVWDTDRISFNSVIRSEYEKGHLVFGENTIVLSGNSVKNGLSALHPANSITDSQTGITIERSKVAVSVDSVKLSDDENKTGSIDSLKFSLWSLDEGKVLNSGYQVLSTDKAFSSFRLDGAGLVKGKALSPGKHVVKAAVSAGIIDITGPLPDMYVLCDPTTTDKGHEFYVSAGKDDRMDLKLSIINSATSGGIRFGENIQTGIKAGDAEIKDLDRILDTSFFINGGKQETKGLKELTYKFTLSAGDAAKISDNSAATDEAFSGITSWKNLFDPAVKVGEKVYVVARATYGTGSNKKVLFGKTETVVEPRCIELLVDNKDRNAAKANKVFFFRRNSKPDAASLSSSSLTGAGYSVSAKPVGNYRNDVLDLNTVTNLLTVSNGTAYRVNAARVDFSVPGEYTVPITGYTFTEKAKGNFEVLSSALEYLYVDNNYYATFIVNDNGRQKTVSVAEIAQDEGSKGSVVKAWPDADSYTVSAGFVEEPKKIAYWKAVKTDNSKSFDITGSIAAKVFPIGSDYTVYGIIQAPVTSNGDITVESIAPVFYDGREHVAKGSIAPSDVSKKSYEKRKSKNDDLDIVVKDHTKGKTLSYGTDYTVTCKNNRNASVFYAEDGQTKPAYRSNAKRPYVQIQGKGNYRGLNIKVYFDILPNDLCCEEKDSYWTMGRPELSGLKDVYVLGRNKRTTKLKYKITTTLRSKSYSLTKKIALKAAKRADNSATGYTGDYKELIYKYMETNGGWTLLDKVDGAGDYLLVLEGVNNYSGLYAAGGSRVETDRTKLTSKSYYENSWQFKVVDNSERFAGDATLKVKKKSLPWDEKGRKADDFGPKLVYKGKEVSSDFIITGYRKITSAGTYTLRAFPKQKGWYGYKDLKVSVKGAKLARNKFKMLYSENEGKSWKEYRKEVPYRKEGYVFTVSSDDLKADKEYSFYKVWGTDPGSYTGEIRGRNKYYGSNLKVTFKIGRVKISDVIDKTLSISASSVSLNLGGSYPDIKLSANGISTTLKYDGKKNSYKDPGDFGDCTFDAKKSTLTYKVWDSSYTRHTYVIKFSDNRSAGSGKMTITGSEFSDSAKKYFEITPVKAKEIKDIKKSCSYGDLVSEVSDVKKNDTGRYSPAFRIYQVTGGGKLKALTKGKDYVPVFNLTDTSGPNTVSVNSGSGKNFKFENVSSGSRWYIYNDQIKSITIKVSENAYDRNGTVLKYKSQTGKETPVKVIQNRTKISTTYCGGKAICPKVMEINVNGKTYSNKKGYEVSYSENTNVGTGKITIRFVHKTDYEIGGTKTFKFKINPATGDSVIMSE
ncbi:MAG: hypothetical protein J5829_05735 [Lachnospiraceae bacterium]|nr:hypothetical protein [Lachnospiraceae bacterium]